MKPMLTAVLMFCFALAPMAGQTESGSVTRKWTPQATFEALRRHEFPEDIVDAVVLAVIRNRDADANGEIKFFAGRPWLPESRSAKQQMNELEAGQFRELSAITGYTPGLFTRGDHSAQLRFGSLDPNKRERLEALEIKWKINTSPVLRFENRNAITLPPSSMVPDPIVYKGFVSEALGYLTVDEFDDYLAYNSPSARKVQQNLSGIEVSEETYLKLVKATTLREARVAEDRLDLLRRQIIQEDLLREYRAVLGDRMFVAAMTTVFFEAAAFRSFLRPGVCDESRTAGLFVDAVNLFLFEKCLPKRGSEYAAEFIREITPMLDDSKRTEFESTTLFRLASQLVTAQKH